MGLLPNIWEIIFSPLKMPFIFIAIGEAFDDKELLQ
jgi:hypothetical protein